MNDVLNTKKSLIPNGTIQNKETPKNTNICNKREWLYVTSKYKIISNWYRTTNNNVSKDNYKFS